MVPRNYYQLQQMKTQNMKREYLGNITQRKKGKFQSSDQRVENKSFRKYATYCKKFYNLLRQKNATVENTPCC